MKSAYVISRLSIISTLLAFALNACTAAGTLTTPTNAPTRTPPLTETRLRLTTTNYNRSIRFEHIGLEQGLSQSVANVILQDRQGFMWIGTEDGLDRFDGYSFKVYRPDAENPNSISDRWITSLAEDNDGFIWIGTRQGGLNRFDPRSGRFTTYRNDPESPRSLANDYIHSVFVDGENNVWVGTQNGLDLYNRLTQTFRHYTSTDGKGLGDNTIIAIYQDRSNTLWIGTSGGGLNRYNSASDSFKAYLYNASNPATLSNNRVTAIAEDASGRLWIGTGSGLDRFDKSDETFIHFVHSPAIEDSLINNSVNSLYVDKNDALWIGTNDGLDVYNISTNHFTHYRNEPTNPNSLSDNTIVSIYEDRGGVLWAGTTGGGLNKYNRQQDKFTYYRNDPNNSNSLSANMILPIHVDHTGTVWIGTSANGLNSFNPYTGVFNHYRADVNNSGSLGSDQIYAILVDSRGILWVGTSKSLDRLDPRQNKFVHYRPSSRDENSLSGLPVYAIYESTDGNLWFGTDHGLNKFDPETETFTYYPPNPRDPVSLSGEPVTAILQDGKGVMWIGTFGNGLNRLVSNRDGFVRYQNKPGDLTTISNNSILCIYEAKDGSLWVGTAGGGLNLYDPATDSFEAFTEKDGLPNNVVYGILEDPEGRLWLSTNFGLSRFDPQTKTFRNFTVSDGLQSNEFNSTAYAIGPNGIMYFGGINGMNSFDPLTIKDSTYIPPIALTTLTQDGKPVNADQPVEALQEITLHWPQNSFEFEYAALSYNQTSKNQYAYMLDGFDSTWNNIGRTHNGRYTNLPGGTYTLLLKGSNSDGIWNELPLQIKVTVVPPFWQTTWFRLLLGLMFAAAIVSGYRLRLESIQNRNRDLEKVVQLRTHELKKRNIEMEALYQADEKILRTVSLNQVFQALVAVAVELLNADRSVVLVWDDEHTQVVPRISHGFAPETLQTLKFSKGEGMIGKVLEDGKPAIVTDLQPGDLRPDIRAAILAEGIHSFVHLPIIVDEHIIGIFNVGFTRPNAINDDNVRLFTALVQRAAMSIANMQLFEQTKDLAVMEERNRLARDLHDSAKQKAFAALAQLGTARGVLKNNGGAVNSHLGEAENLVYEVIQELTFLIQEIYPIALQEKGLITTLREYVFEWEAHNDIMVNLIARKERRLQLEIEQAVYRVIQEALANVARHSGAKRVEVSLIYTPEALQVALTDNGRGFDLNLKGHGMGLRSIRERIGSIHGTIQIQSAPGEGTRLLIQVPLKG